MPYPEALVSPMRAELTRLGIQELKDAAAVDAAMSEAEEGTTLVVVNSVCGCAAANARPAVAMALQAEPRPNRAVTVFAGQDMEATARMREHLAGIPPSSPFIALFKEGEPVYVIERRHIEGRSANAIAADLKGAFARYAGGEGSDNGEAERPAADDVTNPAFSNLPPTFRSIL